ncbi:MAG: PDDEXK nuclease domain-containing protein [Bacteroidales bacterium]|nr:PDDEXK nuclease domain-containing protein [Bacteroidales bacterium]
MKAKNETDNNNTNEMNEIPVNIQRSFSEVYDIILTHRQRVASVVDNESLLMVWHVGQYVSGKLKTSEWGDGIVRQLSEYIRQQDPTTRGWSYRTIYKMVQFFDTYSRSEFLSIVEQNNVMGFAESMRIAPSVVVPVETAQLQNAEIVPFKTAQMPQVLYATGWTNHQLILNRCKTNAERLFYILYAGRERLKNKELERAIKTNVMTSLLDGGKIQTEVLKDIYPQSQVLFKDTAYLDFLGLPQKYKESKLRKDIVSHMKEFILEALDQEERRSNENPTIGILFCKESDQDVVRFALNRSMSPLMIMQYKEQLKVGSVIQRSLVEYCNYINQK